MRLTRHLGVVWLVSLLLAVAVAWIGLAVSVHSLALKQQNHQVESLSLPIVNRLQQSSDPASPWSNPPAWLVMATELTAVKALEIRWQDKKLYQWGDLRPHQWRQVEVAHQLKQGEVVLRVGYENPWFSAPWTWVSVSSLLLSLLVATLTSWGASRWFFARLALIDNISERARKLLKGELVLRGASKERPRVIAKALDYLVVELADARKERSRLDAYIRTQTFLDPVTGLGNRLHFDNQLESATRQRLGGYVLLLEFSGYDELCQSEYCEACHQLLKTIAQCIRKAFDKLNEPSFSRRYSGDFAVLVIGIPLPDIEREINRLLRMLGQLKLPNDIKNDYHFHLGVAAIEKRIEPYQVLAEADMALRAAQLQEANTWFMYQRDDLPEQSIKGSVRWRTLLESALRRKAFMLSSQPVFTAFDQQIHHYEMLLRVKDESDQVIPAHIFLPMAKKCGMLSKIDQIAVEQVLKLMRYDGANLVRCSVNISIESLLEQERQPWLLPLLAQYLDVVTKLIIEVPEYSLHQQFGSVQHTLAQLKTLGCLLTVDQVGKTVVDAHYIKEINADFIKLHASLTRCIDERSENQLFIRSLIGAFENTPSLIFALAVEQKREWRTLKKLGVYGAQGYLFTETTADSPSFLR